VVNVDYQQIAIRSHICAASSKDTCGDHFNASADPDTVRRCAIAALFQKVWSLTQLSLPTNSPDRMQPVSIRYDHDPTWPGWRSGHLIAEAQEIGKSENEAKVDLALLGQNQLPFVARQANLRTASFVDAWIVGFCEDGRTVHDLIDTEYEERLRFLLFTLWSEIRLTRTGRKRSESSDALPQSSAAKISYLRSLSLYSMSSDDLAALARCALARTVYQETLDTCMIRAAIECHLLTQSDQLDIVHGIFGRAISGGALDSQIP
jgi:hypothetical protein